MALDSDVDGLDSGMSEQSRPRGPWPRPMTKSMKLQFSHFLSMAWLFDAFSFFSSGT